MRRRKYPDGLQERTARMSLEALADGVCAKGAARRIADELTAYPDAPSSWIKKVKIDGGARSEYY